MNCTALLFLNEIDDYVCGIFKLFLKSAEDDMFLMHTKQQIKLGLKLDFRATWLNFFPKIFSVLTVVFMILLMLFEFHKLPSSDGVIVALDFNETFWITFGI